jgi:hypothetical protein
MILDIQTFQERCAEGTKTVEEFCDEYGKRLRQHSLRELYVCDRDGEIQLYRINSPQQENLERAKEGARLMRMLVQLFSTTSSFASRKSKCPLAMADNRVGI